MITLIVLLGSFAIFLLITRFRSGVWEFRTPGRYAMAMLLLFTGVSHFPLAEGMARMLPDLVPYRIALVYLTGIAEIVLAGAMVLPPRLLPARNPHRLTGILALLFIAALTPANIYAAIQGVDFGGHGAGPVYLWFRIPLQILFLVWIYLAMVREEPGNNHEVRPRHP